HWKNWSGSVHCSLNKICTPNTIEELVIIVKQAKYRNETIRVTGAGHSFTPLVATGEVIISLQRLRGVETVDQSTNTVSVWGGDTLEDVGEALAAQVYAMENMGDINRKSIAGAISTGKHVTDIHLRNILTQITRLTIMNTEGELVTINHHSNPELLEAAQIYLG